MRFLRGLGGRVLPCGCLVGIYETYEGQTVATVDAAGPACHHPDHRLHHAVSIDTADTAAAVTGAGSQTHSRL